MPVSRYGAPGSAHFPQRRQGRCFERARRRALRNVGNHLDVNPQAQIVVVTHAQGVDFLMEGARDKNGNPYNVAVETLAERGVIFDVCEITLKSRKLDRKLFIPEAKFVPSGVAEIGKLQARGGFAYIKP